MWSWFLHVTGSDNTAGTWYGFWSGFGSDLGELAIVGGLIGIIRHRNCAIRRCWRLGRHQVTVNGTPHQVCRTHHPDDHLTATDIEGG